MNRRSKWLATLLVPTMAASMFSGAGAAFAAAPEQTKAVVPSDIRGNWAQAAIEEWQKNGVVQGYPDGSFQPKGKITRAEVAASLNRLFGFSARSGTSFADVEAGKWYADALSVAREAGYYDGFPGNQAKGDSPISRQDAAVLLARVFGLSPAAEADAASSFKDSAQIAGYAKEAIQSLTGIVKGYPDGSFRPEDAITRAEFVSLLDQIAAGCNPTPAEFPEGTIPGNVVINRAGYTLNNETVAGNLYLAPGIGDGEATLDRVTVNGKTFVAGGGANTVIFKDSNLSHVTVNRPHGSVHVVASGKTTVGTLVVDGDGKLEIGSEASVSQIELNVPASLIVQKGANVGQLTLGTGAVGASLELKGSVGTLTVQADHVTVNGQSVGAGSYKATGGVLTPANGTASGGASSGGTGTGSGTGTGGGTGTGDGTGAGNGSGGRVIDFVDPNATAATKSLFAYLQDIRGRQILFGHQHDTDEGITITGTAGDAPESDVKNDVGDYPAVFGWDTLSLEGKEKPGVSGNPEQSRLNLIRSVQEAHRLGGIVTLSSHMPNFVTGGSFNDTNGSVVEHILPGGDKNAEFNAFLDNIAAFANNAKDDEGNLIPILFRPFHEQNGGWFWWGAKTTSTSQYIELYRYTVEYLRDKKGVHNFLYVFSPNGTFGGSEANYLTTYPGDDYVDVLGMDQYDNQETPGTTGFLNGLVADLKMISRLADSKGKIATFSEFGYSPQGMKTTGNADLHWFTDVLHAIQSDPDAKRMAYMLTWANFGVNVNNLFVPYRNAPNGLGDHELLPDFIHYYDDPYTAFAGEVHDVYGTQVIAAAEHPILHIVSPTDSGTVTEGTATIRARVLNAIPSKVTYTVSGDDVEHPMTLDSDGFYYTADWAPDASLNGKTAVITVKMYESNGEVLQQQETVFVKVGEIQMADYTFDSNIDGIQNNGTYPDAITMNLTHGSLDNNGVLQMNVAGLAHADTWQELKLQLIGLPNGVSLADVKRVKFDAWIPTSAGDQSADASLRGIVMLAPDWDTKYGMTTTERKLADLPKKTIDGVEYAEFSAAIDLNDPAKSAAATALAISLVGSGLEYSGPIYVDNIQLYSTYAEAPQDPALVDDFESYQGSDAALATKWVHAGGDNTAVSLEGAHASGGAYAMKFDYTLAGAGYAGVTKTLGGADWSGFDTLKFWLAPDAKNQKLVIQLKVDGTSFEAYPSLASDTAGWVSLPFKDFAVAPWDTANAGKVITKTSLKNVQEMSIYVNAVNGATLSSSISFDDIRAINDGTGVPNGGDGPGSYPAQPGTLYGFETDVSGWGVQVNNASAGTPSVSADVYAEGSHSLQTTFSLSGDFELTKEGALDLTAVDAISAKVKLSNGTAKARLYIKTGSAWAWFDSGAAATIDSNGFTTLTIPLAGIPNLDAVQSIGIKIESAGESGTSTVYVDDVSLS